MGGGHQGSVASQKRRERDDHLEQDLLNVNLSPIKKLRLSDPGLGSDVSEMQWSTLPRNETMPTVLESKSANPPPEPPAESENQALVLYRPVTPHWFSGGPPVGSVDFPYRVSKSEILHRAQVLNVSDGAMPLPWQRQFSRVSSSSSLPWFTIDVKDQVMVEEVTENKSSADLAVIPWVPLSPFMVPSKITPLIEEVDDETPHLAEFDEMIVTDGISDMDYVDEDHFVVTEITN